jgi:CubicO group peptidase (beta-lactamase class C family)
MLERPSLRARSTQPGGLTRRDVLVGAAVGVGSLLVPTRARGLEAASATLGRDVQDLMAAGRLPGLATAIVRDGDVAWSQGWGWANIDARVPVTDDTLFMLASVSKTVVATAVLQAVEDGLLDFDADVNEVLSFSVRNRVHPDRPITLRQLLTHTSGIRDNWTLLVESYVAGDATMELGTFLRRYLAPNGADAAANNYYAFGPGKSYRYCNMGVSLAAYLVEAASGIGFDTWCENRIFASLGMDRAGWHLAGLPRSDIALPYRWASGQDGYVSYGHYGYPDYPDGALRTTAPQLARHLAMVMNDGSWNGRRLLDADTVREMRRNQVPSLEAGQGLIWYRIWRRGRTLIGHDGGDDGVATVCFFDPHANVGVVALTNGNWRTVKGQWALMEIMDRLFREARRLD